MERAIRCGVADSPKRCSTSEQDLSVKNLDVDDGEPAEPRARVLLPSRLTEYDIPMAKCSVIEQAE